MKEDMKDVEFQGQLLHPSWIFEWVDTGYIEQGSHIIPIELTSNNSDEFAALHLIKGDFAFSSQCLSEANKLGVPDDNNVTAKALIFSGLISYARPFDVGARKFKLKPEMFDSVWNAEARELHAYLYDLRNKHIAHSVNDCERCDAVGVIVTTPDRTRKPEVSGVGVTILTSIGLTKAKMDAADVHIGGLIKFVEDRIATLRPLIHADMKKSLESGANWKMAPIARMPDPKAVSQKRT